MTPLNDRTISLAFFIAAAALSGCGGSGLGSCFGNSGGVMVCYDVEEFPMGAAAVQEQCEAGGKATYSPDPCPTAGVVGHCRITASSNGIVSKRVLNYYPPLTPTSAQMSCQASREGMPQWIP